MGFRVNLGLGLNTEGQISAVVNFGRGRSPGRGQKCPTFAADGSCSSCSSCRFDPASGDDAVHVVPTDVDFANLREIDSTLAVGYFFPGHLPHGKSPSRASIPRTWPWPQSNPKADSLLDNPTFPRPVGRGLRWVVGCVRIPPNKSRGHLLWIID